MGSSLTCICQGQWYFICRWVYLKIKDSHKPDKTPIKIQYNMKIIDLSGKEVLIGGPHILTNQCARRFGQSIGFALILLAADLMARPTALTSNILRLLENKATRKTRFLP